MLIKIVFTIYLFSHVAFAVVEPCQNDKSGESCHKIGWTFLVQSQYQKALDYFSKSCDLSLAKSCNNAALCLEKLDRENESGNYLILACKYGHRGACQKAKENTIIQMSPIELTSINPLVKKTVEEQSKIENEIGISELEKKCKSSDGISCQNLGRELTKQGQIAKAANYYAVACGLLKNDTCFEYAVLEKQLGNIDLAKAGFLLGCLHGVKKSCAQSELSQSRSSVNKEKQKSF